MKISAQEEYGLRCLLQLAQAREPISIPEVAKLEGLSSAYVGKLFFLLRRAGLVTSIRGAKGGYSLKGDPGEISMTRVLVALSGLKREENICERFPGTKKECVHLQGSCSVRSVWGVIYKAIWNILDHTSLADLLGQEEKTLREKLIHQLTESSSSGLFLRETFFKGGSPRAAA